MLGLLEPWKMHVARSAVQTVSSHHMISLLFTTNSTFLPCPILLLMWPSPFFRACSTTRPIPQLVVMAPLLLGTQLGPNVLLYPFIVLGLQLFASPKTPTRTMMTESFLRFQFLLLITYSPNLPQVVLGHGWEQSHVHPKHSMPFTFIGIKSIGENSSAPLLLSRYNMILWQLSVLNCWLG